MVRQQLRSLDDDVDEMTDDESSMKLDADDNIDVNSEEDNGEESGCLNEENTDINKLIEEMMRSCLSPLNNINVVEGSRLNLLERYGSGGGGDEKERKQTIGEKKKKNWGLFWCLHNCNLLPKCLIKLQCKLEISKDLRVVFYLV